MSEADEAVMWIDKRERLPAPEDGDEQGCVLAWHRYQGAMVLRVNNVINYGSYITHWMPLPPTPAG